MIDQERYERGKSLFGVSSNAEISKTSPSNLKGQDASYERGAALLGVKPGLSADERYERGAKLFGADLEKNRLQPDSPTFDWREVIGKAATSVPTLQSLKFMGEATAREEAAVAEPILRVMRGQKDVLKGIGEGVLGKTESVYNDEYAQLGDIFRDLGWSEPAAATAGLAASLLLPSNFLFVGVAGKAAKVNKLLVKPSKDVIRKELTKQFYAGSADLEMLKSRVKPVLEKYLGPSAYDEAKQALARTPDKLEAKSIALDYLERRLARPETHAISPVDMTRKLWYDNLPQGHHFDLKDGVKNYTGKQFRAHMELASSSLLGKAKGTRLLESFTDDLLNAGVTQAPDDAGQVRILVHGLLQQGQQAKQYAYKIMEQEGLREVPRLSQTEKKVYELMVQRMNTPEHLDKMAKVYKASTGNDLIPIKNYFAPIKYKGVPEKEIEAILAEPFAKMTQPSPSAFLKARKGAEAPIRTDLFNLFNEHVMALEWYKEVIPQIIKTKQWLRSSEFLSLSGKKAEMYADEFMESINAGLKYGRLSADNMWSETLRSVRGSITNAIMPYKVSTALVQFDALFDGMAFATQVWGPTTARRILAEVTKSWIKPGYAKEILKKSPALLERRGGIAGEEAGKLLNLDIAHGRVAETLQMLGVPEKLAKQISKAYGKITNIGYAPLKEIDLRVAAGTDEASKKILQEKVRKNYSKLLKSGKKNVRREYRQALKKAEAEADYFMTMINGSSDPFIRPMVLNRGEGARTLFTFQGFHMARAGTIFHTLLQNGILHGNWKAKLTAGFALMGLTSGMVAADQSQKFIWELTTGRKLEKEKSKIDPNEKMSYAEQMMWAVPTQVPFFGNFLESALTKRDVNPPLIRQITNIFTGTTSALKGAKKGETFTEKEKRELSQKRGLMKTLESLFALTGILPGSGELFDVAERLTPEPKKKVTYKKSPQQKLRSQILRGI